jgi:nucleoside 2-deoxyribosyltransferase
MRRIYVASSWRNSYQPEVVRALRAAGHQVYDFRNPRPGDHGFQWSAIDPAWQSWTSDEYRDALTHPIAEAGFANDWGAMQLADTGVLVLPSGRSAHIEAGYFVGARKPLYILLLEEQEPELMYRMATGICLSVEQLLGELASQAEAEATATRFLIDGLTEASLAASGTSPEEVLGYHREHLASGCRCMFAKDGQTTLGWQEGVVLIVSEPEPDLVCITGHRVEGEL